MRFFQYILGSQEGFEIEMLFFSRGSMYEIFSDHFSVAGNCKSSKVNLKYKHVPWESEKNQLSFILFVDPSLSKLNVKYMKSRTGIFRLFFFVKSYFITSCKWKTRSTNQWKGFSDFWTRCHCKVISTQQAPRGDVSVLTFALNSLRF